MFRLLIREMHQCGKDPKRLVFLFGAALAYMLIFSVLFSPSFISRVPAVVYDEDDSVYSRELIQDFEDNERYSIEAYVTSEEEMLNEIYGGRAYISIYIPRDFSRKIMTHQQTSVLFVGDASNLMVVGAVANDGEKIAEAFSNKMAIHDLETETGMDKTSLRGRVMPVTMGLRVLSNPTQGYSRFYLLGLLVAAFQQGIFFSTGASIQNEYENSDGKTCKKLWFAKLIFYCGLGALSWAMVVSLTILVLGIPLKSGILKMAGISIAYIFAITALGLMFSSFFSTEENFVKGSVMYPLAGFILSGYTWPISSMDTWIQYIARVFPQTTFANIVRELFLEGHSPAYGQGILLILLLGLIFVIIGVVNFSRNMKQRAMQHI